MEIHSAHHRTEPLLTCTMAGGTSLANPEQIELAQPLALASFGNFAAVRGAIQHRKGPALPISAALTRTSLRRRSHTAVQPMRQA